MSKFQRSRRMSVPGAVALIAAMSIPVVPPVATLGDTTVVFTGTITTITDANPSTPVVGATVTFGTSHVATDADGKFLLHVIPGSTAQLSIEAPDSFDPPLTMLTASI